MITATFWGGPKDGTVITLASTAPIRIPIATPPHLMEATNWAAPTIRYIEITPVLTPNGWILPWREG